MSAAAALKAEFAQTTQRTTATEPNNQKIATR
jgi:hypothetical protein